MKLVSRTVLALYLLTLLWLILFKFSADVLMVIENYQSRSLNLIPFANNNVREMIDNFVVFIPFGLLLSVNFKRSTFLWKLACIGVASFAIEVVQCVAAIGISDITDVIMNTLGGFFGLWLYEVSNKYVNHEKRDQFITGVMAGLLVLCLLLRIFVLKVKY